MREFIKGVLTLIIVVAIFAGSFLFFVEELRNKPWFWPAFLTCLIGGFGSFVLFVKIHFQRDLVPDFLSRHSRDFFDRDGFCFLITPAAVDGVCVLNVLFQTRYDSPSQARLAIRPAKGLLRTRSKILTIAIDIDCPPAGFGIAQVAMPVPRKYQGRSQKFDVGANVAYPQGKGKMVRFRDGTYIRNNTNFNESFGTVMTLAAAAGGNIILSSPASVRVELPENVAEDIPDELTAPTVEIHWQAGEPVDAVERNDSN